MCVCGWGGVCVWGGGLVRAARTVSRQHQLKDTQELEVCLCTGRFEGCCTCCGASPPSDRHVKLIGGAASGAPQLPLYTDQYHSVKFCKIERQMRCTSCSGRQQPWLTSSTTR